MIDKQNGSKKYMIIYLFLQANIQIGDPEPGSNDRIITISGIINIFRYNLNSAASAGYFRTFSVSTYV